MSDLAGNFRNHPQSDSQSGSGSSRGRLQRSREERLVFGVCGGIAHRFGTDVMIVRVLAVLASAVGNYVFLTYLIAAVVIPKAPRLFDQWGVQPVRRRPRRQLIAYVFLSMAANAVLVDRLPIPTGRTFAVALILAGLLLMQLRSRSVSKPTVSMFGSAQPPSGPSEMTGGWISTANLPPRWGLAGETANPHVWNPTESAQPASATRPQRTSIWHTQFGNLALVVLVGVLAIGLWSNTSHLSPVRQAAIKERLASGPVVVRSKSDVAELNDEQLGDGTFVIDLSGLNYPNTSLDLRMGSGKLELVLPENLHTSGQVSNEKGGVLNVLVEGKSALAPFTLPDAFGLGTATTRNPKDVPTFRFSVAAENGLVCIRHNKDTNGCNSSTPPKK
jgi:phage shock protein C